jgi:hypothetical protein
VDRLFLGLKFPCPAQWGARFVIDRAAALVMLTCRRCMLTLTSPPPYCNSYVVEYTEKTARIILIVLA